MAAKKHFRNKEGRGALFPNNDESPHPRAPGQRGGLRLNGVEYLISGWVEVAKSSGQRYLSLKIERAPDEAQDQPGEQHRAESNGAQPEFPY
jgi:hypothetical protein